MARDPATPRLHDHHHHETRIGTHHVVPGGLLPPWTPIFVKVSIFSYQILKNSRHTGPPEVSLSIAHPLGPVWREFFSI
mgnify:CR=1 FL=1